MTHSEAGKDSRHIDAPGPPISAESLIRQVNRDWALYRELGLDFAQGEEHTEKWNRRFQDKKDRLGANGSDIHPDLLRTFRSTMVSVGDNPKPGSRGLRGLLGKYRGERQMLRRCLNIVKENGYQDLLKKYPCHPAGGPEVFETGGYRYTHRWIKHIYLLGLLNRVLGARLPQGFTAADIGSSYGVFSSLLFQEYPGSHHVLVDLPEQLVFARYFLSRCFPDARIAGPEEIGRADVITRDFLEQHDFVLVPPSLYEKIASGGVDLITSFACLGELKRSFFDYYLQAPVLRGARYFYTANPVDSKSWFQDSDVTVLDYPILDPEKRLHFALSPIFAFPYSLPKSRLVFGYRIKQFQPFFECIGEL
jgi:putative sugar O-methyltransferase